MNSRLATSVVLLALLGASAVGNVMLYSAYRGTSARLELLLNEKDQLTAEVARAADRDAEQRQTVNELRRQLAAPPVAAPAATGAPAVGTSVAVVSPPRLPTTTLGPQAAATPAAAPPLVSAEQKATLQKIEGQVSALRGLAPRAEVPLAFMDRDGLRQFLVEAFDKDYPPLERELDQRRYEALGLLRPDQDITEEVVNLYTQQVVGLYDPDTERMYLIAAQEALSADDRVTFAHEYNHVLQDQHFDLDVLAPDHPDNLDRNMAIHGLIEGDAVLVMLEWARAGLTAQEAQSLGQSQGSDSTLSDAPLILRESLLFPYSAGFAFVHQLHARGGFEAVDAAFRDPPGSTEQVLHPEKYAAREEPVAVVLPPLAPSLGAPWRELGTNVLGELEARVLIQQYLDPATADRAARGWGGDRFSVLSDGSRTALALRTMWDSSADANEFFDAYTASLGARFGAAGQTASSGPGHYSVVSTDYSASVQLAEREVLVLIGTDQDILVRLEGAFGG